MPTTATQNLPYPAASDRPRDTSAHLTSLARAVDARLTAHGNDLARSRKPPATCIRSVTFRTMATSGSPNPVQFDEVHFDTAGMTDLAVDNTRIFVNAPGLYQVGGLLQSSSPGATYDDMTMLISSAGDVSWTPLQNQINDNQIGLVVVSVEGLVKVNAAVDGSGVRAQFLMQHTWQGSGIGSSVTISFAQMWAYWVADL